MKQDSPDWIDIVHSDRYHALLFSSINDDFGGMSLEDQKYALWEIIRLRNFIHDLQSAA